MITVKDVLSLNRNWLVLFSKYRNMSTAMILTICRVLKLTNPDLHSSYKPFYTVSSYLPISEGDGMDFFSFKLNLKLHGLSP
jgi:hypothetical protein